MKRKSRKIARITGIVDGNSLTVSVKGEEKTICLANVDPLGDESGKAEGFLAKFLKVGQRVKIQEFGENNDGETIANVYKGRKRKGKDIALMMVKKGFAEISDDMQYRSDLERLAKFELKAQKVGKGIWADLGKNVGDDVNEDMTEDFIQKIEGIEISMEGKEIEEEDESEVETEDEGHGENVEDAIEDWIDKLEDKFNKASKKLEEKIEILDDKLDQAESEADEKAIEVIIEKFKEKIIFLEEKFDAAIKELEESDSLTGFGKKKPCSSLKGLEILSAKHCNGELLVRFSDDITFQACGKKNIKPFFGGKRLKMKRAEILESDLISLNAPLSVKETNNSFFKMPFTEKGKGDLDCLSENASALISEIKII